MALLKNKCSIRAAAKLNLCLHVLGKRTDGYHLLHSLMAFTDICDVIDAAPSSSLSLKVKGGKASVLENEAKADNIILKATEKLAAKIGVQPNISLTLEKNIPVGAGMGGGSADAAAILRLLESIWEPNLSHDAWYELALELGADVPFCYHGKAAIIEGIGERISSVPVVNDVWAVIVNPNKSLSTKHVFELGVETYTSPSAIPEKAEWSNKETFFEYLQQTRNDLEVPATQLMPVIENVISLLLKQKGMILARMSGSGATCFALFENRSEAFDAAKKVKAAEPDWWVRSTALRFGMDYS